MPNRLNIDGMDLEFNTQHEMYARAEAARRAGQKVEFTGRQHFDPAITMSDDDYDPRPITQAEIDASR